MLKTQIESWFLAFELDNVENFSFKFSFSHSVSEITQWEFSTQKLNKIIIIIIIITSLNLKIMLT